MANHHYCRQIGPYKQAVAVLFTDHGVSYSLQYVAVANLTVAQLQSPDSCICKLPPGYLATVEVWQLAVTGHKQYLFTFKLGPSPDSTAAMGSTVHIETVSDREDGDLPMWVCHDQACSEDEIECEFGKVPKCVDGDLECVDSQGGE